MLEGTITGWNVKGYGFASAGGKTYFVHYSDVPLNAIGLANLKTGHRISFEPQPYGRGEKATKIKLLTNPVSMDNYRETGVVVKIIANGKVCFLHRPLLCNRDIVLHRVMLPAAAVKIPFFIGQRWNYSVGTPSRVGGRYEARKPIEVKETDETPTNAAAVPASNPESAQAT